MVGPNLLDQDSFSIPVLINYHVILLDRSSLALSKLLLLVSSAGVVVSRSEVEVPRLRLVLDLLIRTKVLITVKQSLVVLALLGVVGAIVVDVRIGVVEDYSTVMSPAVKGV